MLLLVVPESQLVAQAVTRGGFEGTVSEAAGSPLSETLVTAVDRETNFSLSTETTPNGYFRLDLLPVGDYEVTVERIGFVPLRLLDVPVRPGGTRKLAVELSPALPPFDSVEVRSAPVTPLSSTSEWLPGPLLSRLPENRQRDGRIGRLSSRFRPNSGPGGLPARFHHTAVDGLIASRATASFLPWPVTDALISRDIIHAAQLLADPVDAEWAVGSGSTTNLLTRRGTDQLQVSASGLWSGGPLSLAESIQGVDNDYGAGQATFAASGPLSESGAFSVGFEFLQLETPPSAASIDVHATGIIEIIEATSAGPVSEGAARMDVASGFGRIDWQASERLEITNWVNVAAVPTLEPSGAAPWSLFHPMAYDGVEVLAGTTLTSRFTNTLSQEVRAGFTRSRWSTNDGLDLPDTYIADLGLRFGRGTGTPRRITEGGFVLNHTLHYRSAARVLKGGLFADVRSYDYVHQTQPEGSFLFANAEALLSEEGWFRQRTTGGEGTSFGLPIVGAHLQASAPLTAGLEVTLGARYEAQRLPLAAAQPETTWLRLAGVTASTEDRLLHRVSPRFLVNWTPDGDSGWQLRASTGLYHDDVDPAVVDELLRLGSVQNGQAQAGPLGGWPLTPSPNRITSVGPSLQLTSPDYAAPRSLRGSIGLAGRLGRGRSLSADVLYRRTSLLTRRRDLNLATESWGTDQHGRPIYGVLEQRGELLGAMPGSNRRFTGFDQVLAFEADGTSSYLGGTVALEQALPNDGRLFASYTFSAAEDDTPAERFQGQRLGSSFQDRRNGPADFDVPHSAVAAAELTTPFPGAPRLALVYRYRSGLPFTPGFRAGVDANGDGFAGNDPAMIDRNLAGMDLLLDDWSCLGDQQGQFAGRNSCRAPGVHSLDLRLSLSRLEVAGVTAELRIDALHLVHSQTGLYDRALYLVDPTRSLRVDDTARTVDLPLIVNPAFGQLIAPQSPGRMLRLGLQISN